MKKLNLTLIAAVIASMGICGVAQAGYGSKGSGGSKSSNVVDVDMSRRAAGSTSGSGHTVVGNCGDNGNAWQGATAELEIKQKGDGSTVEIEIDGAVPNTVFTVWLRVKGGAGFNDGGSPLTGGGATPLVPGSALGGVNDYSPWGIHPAGSATPTNGFTTDGDGDAKFKIHLDFPVVGGAYPFQLAVGERPGHEASANVPLAIVDPRTGNGGPFLLRVISHCTDGLGHGLSPGTREAWFQFP